MPYIGAKHPVFVPITGYGADGFPTYGVGAVVGRMIEVNEAIEFNDAPLYSDDGQSENDKSFRRGKFTGNMDDLSRAIKKLWFGMQEMVEGGQTILKDAATYDSPYGGFGFYRVRTKGGVRSIEAHWYYKSKWVRPNNEAKTKGESTEWQTPKVEGEVMTLDDAVMSWHKEVEFATEAEAVGFLDALAGIVVPAALVLSSAVPADGAAAVNKANSFVLTFNNEMAIARCKFMCLRNDTGADVPITSVTWDADHKVATLAHGALNGATMHEIIIMVVDIYGGVLDTAIDFTTVA